MNFPNAREAAYLAIQIYGAFQKPLELEKLHQYLVDKKYETFIELGTCHGGMTWFFAHLPNFKSIVSVDIPEGPFGGGPTERDRDIMKNWASGDYEVTLCNNNSQSPETVEEVKSVLPFCDCLLIDADHTYEGVKKDYELWSPLVRAHGAILFHDIADHSKSTRPDCKVRDFWEEIKVGKTYLEITQPTDPDWGGIGIVEV